MAVLYELFLGAEDCEDKDGVADKLTGEASTSGQSDRGGSNVSAIRRNSV